jgi:hypothetical protein
MGAGHQSDRGWQGVSLNLLLQIFDPFLFLFLVQGLHPYHLRLPTRRRKVILIAIQHRKVQFRLRIR